MTQTYTRQSSFSDGDTITAALFNDEYNQLVNAFAYSTTSSSTGHQHDGTAAEGGNIHTIGDLDFLNKIVADSTNNRWGFFVEVSSSAVEQIRIQDGAIVPVTDNDIDLGTSSLEFKDAFFDGTVTTDGLTVSSTTNLDGAIQVDNTITVGVDDTGYDVKFFGDTASAYMLWDTSTDDLVLAGAAGLDIAGDIDVDGTANLDVVDIDGAVDMASTLTLAGNADFNGDLDVDGTTNLDAVDIDGAVQIDGTVTVGVDDTGLDVKFFGATSGSYMLWDESADSLLLTDSTPVKIGDSQDLTLYHDGSNSYITNAVGALKVATETSGIAVTIGHTTSETTVADNLTVTGNASIGGNLDVTGSFDMSDADITNIGSIALDTITNDGTDITLDSSGDIILDADGADIFFKDAGTTFGSATNTSGNLIIKSGTTTALTFSGANVTGAGTYTGGGLMTTGGNIVIPDAGNIGSASDTDAISISSGGVVTMNQIPVFSAGINVSGGTIAGTLATAAQGNVTSLGTLTALTVDDVAVDGKVITMTGSASDTAVFTAGTNGTLSIVTTDAAAAAANIQITADGTVDIDSAGVLTLDSGAAINLEPAAGSAILLDGTISVDAGVVTGATSITSTAFVGTLSTAAQTNITSLGTLTTLTVDDITINGSTISDGGDFTLDVGGDIVLDADGSGTVKFKDGGTEFGRVYNGSNNLYIKSIVSDGDLIFLGNDGGSAITALTLDMSEAGAATFNNKVTATELDISGNIDVDGTTNLDVVDIDGATQIDATVTVGVDDTGYDVKFFGATSGKYALWDESANSLILSGTQYINHTSNIGQETAGSGWTPDVQVNNTTNGGLAVTQWNTANTIAASPKLWLSKNGGATIGTHAQVVSSENLGTIYFSGSDGTDFVNAASIHAVTGSSPGSNDMPGILVFSTTADGASSVTERMRITETGAITMTSTLGVTGAVTANAGVVVDNITIDGTEIDLSSGNLTLDVAGSLYLDSDDGLVYFLDGGTTYGQISRATNDLDITSFISDGDLTFRGNDGGSYITALTLDMSDAGAATFNGNVTVPNLYVADDIIHTGDANTYMSWNADNLTIYNGGTNSLYLASGEAVFNEGSGDVDFRVESNGNANMIFVNGGNDTVSIGTASDFSTPILKVYGTAINQNSSYYQLALESDLAATSTPKAGISFRGEYNTSGGAHMDLGVIQGEKENAVDAETGGQLTFHTRVNGGNITERMKIASTGATSITTAGNEDTLSLISTDADANAGPNLRLYRNSSSPADSDIFGQIDFEGRNDNSQDFVATQIKVAAGDVSDGTEDSQIEFDVMTGGTLREYLRLAAGSAPSVVVNEDSQDIDFRVESNDEANMLFVDGGLNRVGIGKVPASNPFEVAGAATFDSNIHVTGDIRSTTSGTSNFRAGVNAGNSIASGGNYNVVVGDEAGTALTTGDDNVAIGYAALASEDAGTRSTAVGYAALQTQNNDGTNYNTAVGHNVGQAITTGINNTLVGSLSGDALIDADYNVAYGYNALSSDTYGSRSTALGYSALAAQNFTTANNTYNTAVGYNAGGNISTGAENTLIGGNAGDILDVGGNNVAVGSGSLTTDTKGSKSVAVGVSALATQNFTTATDSHNTAVGFQAGAAVTTGQYNTLVGSLSGDAITTGDNNIFIGYIAGSATDVGDGNIGIGYAALMTNVDGSGSTAVGNQALRTQEPATATAMYNVALGYNTMYGLTTGLYNTAVGAFALDATVTANYNTAVGYAALGTNTSAISNTGIGYNALGAADTGGYNTAVGSTALDAVTEADRNTAVGYAALTTNILSDRNVAVGAYSLFTMNIGSNDDGYNTAVGEQAGYLVSTGQYNTFVGGLAGDGTDDGGSNVAMGYQALSGNCGDSNTVLGAGAAIETTGSSSTCVGKNAGYAMTSADNNLLLGADAGRTGSPGGNFTTHDNRITLGDENIVESNIQVDWTVASDERDKTDFTALDIGLDFVNALAPVTYKWDKRSKYIDKDDPSVDLDAVSHDGTHKEDWLDIGFKAQSVLALEEAAGYSSDDKTNLTVSLSGDGKQYGLQYSKFVPILVKAVQELSATVETLQAEIELLKGE